MTYTRRSRAIRVAALVIVTAGPLLGMGGCRVSMIMADANNPSTRAHAWWLWLASVIALLGAPALGSLLVVFIAQGWQRVWACVPTVMNAGALLFTLYGGSLIHLQAGGFIESEMEARALFSNIVHLLALFVAIRVVQSASAHPAECAKGICSKCGYDLTGNTSGVCPECGTSCWTRVHHDEPR